MKTIYVLLMTFALMMIIVHEVIGGHRQNQIKICSMYNWDRMCMTWNGKTKEAFFVVVMIDDAESWMVNDDGYVQTLYTGYGLDLGEDIVERTDTGECALCGRYITLAPYNSSRPSMRWFQDISSWQLKNDDLKMVIRPMLWKQNQAAAFEIKDLPFVFL